MRCGQLRLVAMAGAARRLGPVDASVASSSNTALVGMSDLAVASLYLVSDLPASTSCPMQ